jgi:hypothetical protein
MLTGGMRARWRHSVAVEENMKLSWIVLLALSFVLAPSQAGGPDLTAPEAAQRMAEAARAFWEGLSATQRGQTRFEFGDNERHNWHYFPRSRKGIALKDLNDAQNQSLRALLRSALSAPGYDKVANVMLLEGVLGERSGMYDPSLYYVSMFGDPGAAKPWGWRFEGHHLSLNFTLVGGQFVSVTPSFLGANPAEVRDGPRKGLKTLAAEEELARKLLLSLDETQRATAIFDSRSYAQLASGAAERVSPLAPIGIAVGELSPAQRDLLLQLLAEYSNLVRPDLARLRLERLRVAGLENIRFAWSGGAKRGEAHYYRLQGPTFLLEYDNSQNGANHIHSVWRDFDGDFGRDLLADHWAAHHRVADALAR